MRGQQEYGADAGAGHADGAPKDADLKELAPGKTVAEIAFAGDTQVPADPDQFGDQNQHRGSAGDPMKGPAGEARCQFIGGVGQDGADQSGQKYRPHEPCEGAHQALIDAKTRAAAATVASMSAGEGPAERNLASKAGGARYPT